jgi:alcohol dehydrogenase (NADP+)
MVFILTVSQGPTLYPCCVGHEVVGHAVKVGKNVKHIKVGDRVGVGAQSSSCLKPDCKECSSGNESYCRRTVGTYNGKYPDGSKSYGGYATYVRCTAHFAVQIPKELDSASAAPMLCGGITTYSPLKRNGAGPGKRVGIIGIGGLGHFGVIWAKALGSDKVVAISRSSAKKADALKMGADEFIATGEDKDWAKKNSGSLDLIVCTVSDADMPIQKYLQLLDRFGTLVMVGAPEDNIPSFNTFPLLSKGVSLKGSSIGPPHEIVEMLQLAADKGLKSWIQEWDMKDANEAIKGFEEGKPRYRFVLKN